MPDGTSLERQALHPKIARALAYWRAIHPAAGVLPSRRHLDPMAIPELLPGVWLLDVQHVPFRLRYRLVGTRIVESFGREITGGWFDEVHPEVAGDPSYLERYRTAVATCEPSWRRGKPKLWTRRGCSELENIVLPLAGDGAQVDMLMAVTVLYWFDGRSE
jgi:hypothetical protein